MSDKNNDQITIPDTHANKRLDQAVAMLAPEYSRTQIQTWIEAGSILVNGKQCKAKMKVRGGEIVSFHLIKQETLHWEGENIPLNIVHEDDALLIVNKPVGMVVHPGAGNLHHTLLNALLHYCSSLRSLPRAGILHRLDKDTSGLIVIAKTAAALKNLSSQLKKRTLLREYQAIIYGKLISGGTIEAPISRHPLQRKRMAIIETGKNAITYYRIAEKYRAHTRLIIRLETGRTHQIRVHMASIHHPIVGDMVYGRIQLTKGMKPELIQFLRQFKRQALHAFALGLTHPLTQHFVRWEVELPQDMKTLIQLLKEDMLP